MQRRCIKLLVAGFASCCLAVAFIYLVGSNRVRDHWEKRIAQWDVEDTGENSSSHGYTRPTCTPHQHIMFLKMHKSGSSTVQNIFLRYAAQHNLIMGLPEKGHILGHPNHFMSSMIPPEQLAASGVVDIFAQHSRLHLTENLKVLHADTVFVTVMREPGTLFESIYHYCGLQRATKLPLELFVELPLEKQRQLLSHRWQGSDSMLFNLGLQPSSNMTVTEARQNIEDIDDIFDLVMITEKLDESLILLKELLCWEFDDILVFTRNARKEANKSELTEDLLRKMRRLNSGDVLLYNYFLAKHDEAVRSYGCQKMAEQVAILQAKRSEFFDFCNNLKVNSTLSLVALKDTNYVIGSDAATTCRILTFREIPLVNYVREHQNVKLLAPILNSGRKK